MFGWVRGARTFGWDEVARIFGRRRKSEVDERAKLLGRMIALLVHSLRTKSYDEFVARFSNPGQQPDALKRLSSKAHFQMRVSPTCWYDATVSYARDDARSLCIAGGGDDFGVVISANATDDGVVVKLDPADGQKPGRDARAVTRALLAFPGFRGSGTTEDSVGVLPDYDY